MGLCSPEEFDVEEENIFPMKNLPSNPFMIETKKKKKNKWFWIFYIIIN